MRVKTMWTCACQWTGSITLVKPNALIPTFVKVECGDCGSRFLLRFIKKAGNKQLDTSAQTLFVSKHLEMFLAKQAKEAKSPEMT